MSVKSKYNGGTQGVAAVTEAIKRALGVQKTQSARKQHKADKAQPPQFCGGEKRSYIMQFQPRAADSRMNHNLLPIFAKIFLSIERRYAYVKHKMD